MALDGILKRAQELCGDKLSSDTKDKLTRFSETFSSYRESKSIGGYGTITGVSSSNTAENFSLLGDGYSSLASGVTEVASQVQTVVTNKSDLKKQIKSMKDMFGISSSELFSSESMNISDSRAQEIADRILQVQDVSENTTGDLSSGRYSVGDYIDNKYTGLTENMPDVSGYVDENIDSVTSTVNGTVSDIGSSIVSAVSSYSGKDIFGNTVSAGESFGNVMGNAEGETDSFFEKSMSKITSSVSSAAISLQKDILGNFPSVDDAVSNTTTYIQKQIGNSIPSIPSVDTVLDTLLTDTFTANIESDVIWEAVDTIISYVPDSLPEEVQTLDEFASGMQEIIVGGVPTGEYEWVEVFTTSYPQQEFVMAASEAIMDTYRSISSGLTDIDVNEALSQAITAVTGDLSSLIPDLPSVASTVTDAIGGMDISSVASSLTSSISTMSGNLLGNYTTGFENSVVSTISDVLNSNLGSLPDFGSTSEFIDSILPSMESDILSNIPNFPTGSTVRDLLSSTVGDSLNSFMGGLDLNSISSNITGVTDTLTNLGGGLFDSVTNTASDMFGTGFDSISSNFGQLSDITTNIGDVVSNYIPDISSNLTSSLASLQTSLPDISSYLNTNASDLMNSITSNLPAWSSTAQEGLNNMLNLASNLADFDAGQLTDMATNMLSNVDLSSINIPDISSLQMGSALSSVFGDISSIQSSQFYLDCMDKATEMIPNLDAALDAFSNWEWEGSGFSLGEIGDYLTDIGSSEEMLGLVSEALAGAPPLQQCNQKVMGALNQAFGIQGQVEGAISAAEGAIDTIEEIFDLF